MENWPSIVTAVVAVLGFTVTWLGVFFTLRTTVQNLHEDLKEIKVELKQIVQLTIAQNLLAERITAIQLTQVNQGKRLDDLTRRVNTYFDMKLVKIGEEHDNL